MIKVIVVDDEVRVCQLICSLVDWQSLDMEIVGVAHNGEQALQLVRSSKPDIAITDIRMPGLDGLELIRRAKDECGGLEFIIISGYRHFEYAQSAMKYGVSDYLLKPIKRDELYATLVRMRENYRLRSQQISLREQMEIHLQNDMDKLRRGLLNDLLQNGEHAGLTIESVNANYHYSFQPGCFQVFILKVDAYESAYADANTSIMEKALYGLQAMLKPVCFDMQVYLLGSRIYGVMNYGEGGSAKIRKMLKGALDELIAQARDFGGMRLTIGLGEVGQSIDMLRQTMHSAGYAVGQRLLTDKSIIDGDTDGRPALDGNGLMAGLQKEMGAALDIMNTDMVADALRALYARAMQSRPSGVELLALAQDAYRTCLIMLRNYADIEDIDGMCGRFAERADICGSADALSELLVESITGILGEAMSRNERKSGKSVRIAKQYIADHYMQPISLEIVAEHVGFNPSYFSTLFKKESGQNFGEYLAEVRMNKAKQLLKEGGGTIAGICSQVGYSDTKHFTQSFKKHTGLKPNEYRKLFSR